MSGIFGIIRVPGALVADVELDSMADALKHRGPDGVRRISMKNAGLGHCMLQCTPESAGEILPLQDEASGLSITADARIDNREQLMDEFGIRSGRGRRTADSELILRAYRRWGDACVDYLLGDFAFAVWDERAQALFVARDQMGCKPLYFYCKDDVFVFASSAVAVARVSSLKTGLNEARVFDYLVRELEGVNTSCSWYNEVNRLAPAHCGYFRDGRLSQRAYWTLQPADLSHLNTDADYLAAFTDVYRESVRCRLRSPTTPASMLSGGLDSSTVVALARELQIAAGGPALRTFSAVSAPGEACPETRSIEAILAQGNLEPSCLSPESVDHFADDLDRVVGSLEDPFDGSWTLLALMSLAAAGAGGNVLLTGLDGEYAVGAPTNYIVLLLRRRQWRRAWSEAQGFSRHYYRGAYSPRVLYMYALRACLLPSALRKVRSKVNAHRRYSHLLATHGISLDFASRVQAAQRVREYDGRNSSGGHLTLPAWHRHAVASPDLTVAIERYERLGSYFGLEMRHPLLDVRLLSFAAALPLEQRVRDGWSKFMLRRLANEKLPQSVAWREGWEQLGWVFTARQAEQSLAEKRLPLESVNELLAPYLRKSPGAHCQAAVASGEDPATSLLELWGQYCLSNWLRDKH